VLLVAILLMENTKMSIKDIILNDYVGTGRVGVDLDTALFNINDFSKKVSGIESSYGTNQINSKSSARGIYQFLTKGEGNSFQTGLQRVKNAYTQALGANAVPRWVDVALSDESRDPMKLSDLQQEEVMLANLYMHPKTNLSGMLEGDATSSMDLYSKYHHTDTKHSATKARAKEFFKPPVMNEDGTQQTAGMGKIKDTITRPIDSGAVDTFQGDYTVKPNDNMYQIAKRNGMTLEDLVAINPQVQDPNMIRVGEQLNIGNSWWEDLKGKVFG
jgi:hypothetical protein